MTTVEQIRGWLATLPGDAEFVVWGDSGTEHEIIGIAHVKDDQDPDRRWNKAIVCIGEAREKERYSLAAVYDTGRHLRVVE